MTREETDKIFDKLEEVWGDWEYIFKVMNENNLKVEGSIIRTSKDEYVDSLYEFDYFCNETIDLFGVAYEYYKKAHSSSNIQMGTEKAKVSEPDISKKSKYMKLC